ncbi:MAG: DUF3105 domain-containing protein [Bacillati bacterium ANGP1]|uniref:DUF3105 domain-containing protein n=1 Tax=Candidatus Segetimicrobium genomatis TaxID=2569760 RepID=A0A537J1L6_9BACT|nr:MAG: DUF3105 domain-containing protein [Terrabacteria group bacterium ANGP1]
MVDAEDMVDMVRSRDSVDRPLGKKELRRLARQQRKAEETERQERARRRRMGIFAAAGVLVLSVVVWVVWGAVRANSPSTTAGVAGQPKLNVIDYPEQGREHIFPGQQHPSYNSDPPTSGWHFPQPADWGYYNGELPDELVVHNLEHGGIWISFKSADDTEVINKLVTLSRRYRSKVIITLRPKNDSRIAVAAWTRLMKLDHYDEAAIVNFINRFKNRGPELFPD